MPSISRELPLELKLYSKAELIEHRRSPLRYARSFPIGPDRNRHKQVALLFRALFKNEDWLEAHTIDGSCGNSRFVVELNLALRIRADGEDHEQTMDGGSS
jgi:hypothetical protein